MEADRGLWLSKRPPLPKLDTLDAEGELRLAEWAVIDATQTGRSPARGPANGAECAENRDDRPARNQIWAPGSRRLMQFRASAPRRPLCSPQRGAYLARRRKWRPRGQPVERSGYRRSLGAAIWMFGGKNMPVTAAGWRASKGASKQGSLMRSLFRPAPARICMD